MSEITDKNIVDALCVGATIKGGWHGNPRYHLLDVTLYFGDKDPRALFTTDAHGNAMITRDLLDEFTKLHWKKIS